MARTGAPNETALAPLRLLRFHPRMPFPLRRLFTRACLLCLSACGGSTVASSATQVGPNAPPPGETSTQPPASPNAHDTLGAHKLAIAAVSCWFGGVWADAIGEPPENRKASDEARCNDVVRQVWGTDDKAKVRAAPRPRRGRGRGRDLQGRRRHALWPRAPRVRRSPARGDRRAPRRRPRQERHGGRARARKAHPGRSRLHEGAHRRRLARRADEAQRGRPDPRGARARRA